MKIEILSREKSLEKIADDLFVARWNDLAEKTEHCTVIQEYGFVASWYNAYSELFDPMMVLGYDEEENIVGILPLAISCDSGKLSYAGEDQAEYHGWISPKEYEEAFIVHSLIAIKKTKRFPLWKWGWMPPNINLGPFDSTLLEKNGIFINRLVANSPLNNLNKPEKLKKMRKHIKNKINRFNREGELKIELIKERRYAEKLFDTIIDQYNFRHLSLYGHIPFEMDKHKRDWHLSQLDFMPDNAHFTVLWQGDELLACNFGCCTEERVLLGLLSYDPSKGKNSPGSVFLIKLLEYMQERGYHYLDLTPGGDDYKKRFANDEARLMRPTVCFSKYQQLKDSALMSLRLFLRNYFSARDLAWVKNLKKRGLYIYLKGKIEAYTNRSTYYIYNGATEKPIAAGKIPPLRSQQYRDLLLYQNGDGVATHKDLVYSAMKKFEQGDRLYTIISGKRLLASFWLADSGRKHWHPHLKNRVNLVKNGVFIYDFYSSKESDKNQIFQACIQGILREHEKEKISPTYLVRPKEIDEEILHNLGFFHQETVN